MKNKKNNINKMNRKGNYKTSNDFIQKKSEIITPVKEPYLLEELPQINQINQINPINPIKQAIVEQKLNTGDPNVWGPPMWFTLHNGASKYPIKASPIFADRMKNFILGLPVMIPCDKCQDHATAHIEANWSRLDDVVSGRDKLFKFFVDFHNRVNKRYNKPEMTYETAYKLYKSG